MTDHNNRYNLLIIADDFTGANDTGVQFAKKGAHVDVLFPSQTIAIANGGMQKKSADVIVINTESRAKPSSEAARDVKKAIELNPAQRIFKKIDSTFRGNVGAEIEAALTASGAKIALVAAAVPAAGRTTKQGCCYVYGKPLIETEFASDPKTPIHSSKIKHILASQTAIRIEEVNLSEIRANNLLAHIDKLSTRQPVIIVLDGQTDGDLQIIGQSLLSLNQPYLLVGAAGLANALPNILYKKVKPRLPVLVIAGSMSAATRKQIDYATQDAYLAIVDINIEPLINQPQQQESDRVIQQAIAVLASGKHCVLRTCRDEKEREKVAQLCQTYQLTRQQIGDRISQCLGSITRHILQYSAVGGLFLTGGDIAMAVAQALKAQGYRIQAEVAPCIPCGTFVNSEIDDLPVITKAGGFGNETALRDSLFFIEEMYRDQ